MVTTFRIKAEELTEDLLKKIKDFYRGKEIEMLVYEVDETDYLLSNKANSQHLNEALERYKKRENIVYLDPKEFQ